MKRRLKQTLSEGSEAPAAPHAAVIVRIQAWRARTTPMLRWQVLVPARVTFRELHGVFQVAMRAAETQIKFLDCRNQRQPAVE